jgi:hypothetical protein
VHSPRQAAFYHIEPINLVDGIADCTSSLFLLTSDHHKPAKPRLIAFCRGQIGYVEQEPVLFDRRLLVAIRTSLELALSGPLRQQVGRSSPAAANGFRIRSFKHAPTTH